MYYFFYCYPFGGGNLLSEAAILCTSGKGNLMQSAMKNININMNFLFTFIYFSGPWYHGRYLIRPSSEKVWRLLIQTHSFKISFKFYMAGDFQGWASSIFGVIKYIFKWTSRSLHLFLTESHWKDQEWVEFNWKNELNCPTMLVVSSEPMHFLLIFTP